MNNSTGCTKTHQYIDISVDDFVAVLNEGHADGDKVDMRLPEALCYFIFQVLLQGRKGIHIIQRRV